MNSKLLNSKTISTKDLSNNLKNGADNPIILDKKKNDEIKGNKVEKFNKRKQNKLMDIDDTNSFHKLKSSKCKYKQKNKFGDILKIQMNY